MIDRGGTILALSSGALPSAVAILRLSGPQAASAASSLIGGGLPASRQAALKTFRVGGEVVDRGLLLHFPAPHSFTGENVVELQVTGSVAVVRTIERALLDCEGVRAAEPGEFARRALMAGKMDLTEVEGLAALIDAESDAQRRLAMMAADGALRTRVESWRERLIGISADAEAELDFGEAEDDVAERISSDGKASIRQLGDDMSAALADASGAERIRSGVTIAIVGPPNAGKSTLLNRIAGSDVAITSELPGTTRDLVEVPVRLGAYRATLVDTAGLRDAPDPLEAEGIRRARLRAADADIILDFGDGAPSSEAQQRIGLAGKCDRGERGNGERLAISGLTGEGVEELLALLQGCLQKLTPAHITTVTARQTECLGSAVGELRLAEDSVDPVIRAEHLRHALAALSRLTGHGETEEMLDALFARFCVGK